MESMSRPSPAALPDFHALFDATPSPYLVLAADFSIVSVNQAYLQATGTSREDILGRNMFQVFPDNPEDPAASGVGNLRASLLRVLRNKKADTMAIQKYDIPVSGPDGIRFEEHYWSPTNTPVLDSAGEVVNIIHRVEDVTDFVRARDRSASLESRIDDQALEIEMANRRLREANDDLEKRVAARTEAQRRTEEDLRESGKRFRLMADSIPQIVWIVDDSGRAVYFNKQWSAYTGVNLDTILPEEVSGNFVHPGDHAITMQAWELAQRGGQVFSIEHRIRSASGEYRWFLVRAEPYRDPNSGKISLWFGTSTDVHDRKLAEAALKRSEERYRSLFESIDEGFCIIKMLFDEDGHPFDYRFCETNPSFEQQTGLLDAVGKTMRELAPENEAHWYEIYGRVAMTGESIRFESEAKALRRWYDVFASRIDEESGPKVALLFKDITNQKRLTETLRRSEHAAIEAARQADAERHRLDAVLQAAPVGIVVSDADGAILLVNAAHKHIWGAQHPYAKNTDQFREWKGWWADHSERHDRPLKAREWATARILAGEENPRDTVTIESFETPPVRRTVLITGAPVKDGQGKIAGAVVAQMDISDRIRAEDALRQADRRKDEFLAMLAHELRNPLAPIAAAADLLGLCRLDEARLRQTSDIIARQVRHMTELIDDLLDVSRVTRGLVKLSKAKLDAKRILSDAVEQVRPLIEARRHRLAVHTPPDTAFVLGDVKRLVQAIANLLNNAAKYTPEGGDIVLSMEVDGSHIKIVVSDNGVGMTQELQSRAFELFAQATRTSDRSQGGLGIGLALVRSLVELHGGSITVHSDGIGKGSRFVVCLPHLDESAASLDDNPGTVALQSPGKSLKVMVVDDNVDAARMLAMFIEALGHQVLVEHHPRRAIERSRIETPDICLLDIGLPDMDGNELARRLRSQPETAQAILIAVTGYGQEQDRDAALNAGFDHHFAKPVDNAKLTVLLAGVNKK
ncbi:PAS domain S-box protein [Noviherbaspirillum sp. CPCC 100848]|uniref:histidine kinase n=2 Tax=Noviherbaspirillum album TaxID=3080276 RepID=A0ABU6JFU9_9BURK|nr:PAS domain S-box protein [Noviherbaspirillum sp. CPCC 100848]